MDTDLVTQDMPKMELLDIARKEKVSHRDYYTRAELAHNINEKRKRLRD